MGWWMGCLLFGWGLSSILAPYHWYFPADFERSEFLLGRRHEFQGVYRWAFYAHIICGPITLVTSFILIATGGHSQFRSIHRLLGRVLVILVTVGILPSGLVMSRYAFAGPIAGWGFAALAVGVAICTWFAIYYAVRRRFDTHRQWAMRVFILLCSPLLLRLASSVLSGLGVEADWGYQFNAWLSWLLPLLMFEFWRLTQRTSQDERFGRSTPGD